MEKRSIKSGALGALVVLSLIVASCSPRVQNSMNIQATRTFIQSNWENAIRFNPNDTDGLIGLPKPYSIPSITGAFQEMYYWDTYFTNVGLIIDGKVEQAKNNTEDILYLVQRYGFMPNGSRTVFLSRSQPPYLSMMVRDVYEHTHDKEWLKKALPVVEKEYQFWMTNRITPVGLNRYASQNDDAAKRGLYDAVEQRLGENFRKESQNHTETDKFRIGSHFLAEAESGWDFSPRFDSRCLDFCPVDLNSNLYMYEMNFAYFNAELGLSDGLKWKKAADKRKMLMHQYCQNKKDHLFYDYDFVNNKLSDVLSAANFNVLWTGVADKKDAFEMQKQLSRLELPHGVAACEKGERKYAYQWDYPNGWANLQFLAIKGLNRYGYKTDARRIAMKYSDMVSANYIKTKNLWEKYNVVDGTTNTHNEYGLPTMMGWTAGVFVYASDYLTK
ncbi:MAG: trehalase family glycosidase [Bacteroidota bacterium]|nr:trehalase family glycosidase [Bacteroidota bacterium]